MLAQRSSIILSCESVCSGVNKAMRYLTRGCIQNGGPPRNLNPCWPPVNGTLSKNYLPRNPFRPPLGDPPGPLVLACSGFSASRGSLFSESSFTVKGFHRREHPFLQVNQLRSHSSGDWATKKPAPVSRSGPCNRCRGGLAFGFDGFFDLALFFLFLLLELVADEFEDGHFRAITHASTSVDNARVAAGAVGKLRRDFAEELLRHGRGHQVSRGLAACLQSVALPEGDNLFGDGACGLGARQRGGDAAVFKQIGDQVAQGRAAVPRIASQFRSRFQMSHGFSFPLSIANFPLVSDFSGGRDECPGLPVVTNYRPIVSSEVGGAVWLGSGGQMMRPCSSNFMPRLRPIFTSISLISLSDFRPKFLVFSISFSLFCTSSRMVWMLAFFKQL